MGNKKLLNNLLICIIFFVNYIGYYLVLLLVIKLGFYQHTRIFMIPLRALFIVSLITLLVVNIKKINFNRELFFFIAFVVIYLINLGIHFFNNDPYYISVLEVLLYFGTSVLIPFLVLSTFSLKKRHIKRIFSVILISGVIFTLFVIYFYGNFLGKVERLSTGRIHENTISPLSLSYSSSLIIGIVLTYLFFNKINIRKRIVLIIPVVLSVIPFFLGVSRGSLIALFLPFIIMAIARRKNFSIYLALLILLLSILSFYFIDVFTGGNFIDRLSNIIENIKNGDNSVARFYIWKSSILQFFESPIFGGKLALKGWGVYPHNIILETLQFTGIIGFIPFIALLFRGIQISINIFINYAQYSWISIIFLQSLIQSLFSGAIFNATWYWLSIALLIAFSYFIENEKDISSNYDIKKQYQK